VLWRLAARIITGPAAFFVAGLIDIGVFGLAAISARARKRLGLRRG
jgi:hypothetical protein